MWRRLCWHEGEWVGGEGGSTWIVKEELVQIRVRSMTHIRGTVLVVLGDVLGQVRPVPEQPATEALVQSSAQNRNDGLRLRPVRQVDLVDPLVQSGRQPGTRRGVPTCWRLGAGGG